MIFLRLGTEIEYSFDSSVKKTIQGLETENFRFNLDLLPPDKVVEHEKTLDESSNPESTYLDHVITSIQSNGFFEPVLVTRAKNQWVIADGTHRLHAIRELNLKWIPAIILNSEDFSRDIWAMLYTRTSPNDFPRLPNGVIKESFFTNSKVTKEGEKLSSDGIKSFLSKEQMLGVCRNNDKLFGLVDNSTESRLDHLRLAKKIHDLNVNSTVSYVTVEEAANSRADALLLAPPKDALGDIDLLVEYPEVRREKGSRTMVPWRVAHLPVSVDLLNSNYVDAIKGIEKSLDTSIGKSETGFLYLEMRKRKDWSLDPIGRHLFGQHLFIANFSDFKNRIPKNSRQHVEKAFKRTRLMNKSRIS